MSKPKGLKSGQPTPVSGQYQEIGPRGKKGNEITGVQGKTLPPTTRPGATFNLVDPTRHKSQP